MKRWRTALRGLAVVAALLLASNIAMREAGFVNEPPFALAVGREFRFGDVTLKVDKASSFEWAGDTSDGAKYWPIRIVGADDWIALGIRDLLVYQSPVPAQVRSPGIELSCLQRGPDIETCRSPEKDVRPLTTKRRHPSFAIGGNSENEFESGRDGAYFHDGHTGCQIIFLDFADGKIQAMANIDCKARPQWPELARRIDEAFTRYVVKDK